MAGDFAIIVLFLLGLALVLAAVIFLERYLHAAFWAAGARSVKAHKFAFLFGYFLFGALGYNLAAPFFTALHSSLNLTTNTLLAARFSACYTASPSVPPYSC